MTGSVHLDDERLSDLIDGNGSGPDLAHTEECDECRTRLEAWRLVSLAVAAKPRVPASERETAIGAALSHSENPPAGGSPVADLDERRRRRLRLATRIGTAAAAVAVIAGVSTSVLSSGPARSKHHNTTGSPPPLVALGEVNGPSELVAALNGTRGASGTGTGPAAGPAFAASGASAGSTSSGTGAASSGSAGALSATQGAAARPASPTPAAISPPPATTPRASPCPSPVNPRGTLSEEATLLWKGTPAVAFVYSSSKRHTAVVESIASCKVLATVTY